MRILFTAEGKEWSSPVDPRLGRAEFLVIFDEERGELSALSNEEARSVQHAGPYTAQKILELAPDTIITGHGPGGRACDLLEQSGITIYIGAGGMSLKEAYEAFKAGRLESF